MSEKNYANIMMIGKTGVGKSSFLNYLLQDNKFKAGTFANSGGVTQGFETSVFDNVNGIPLRVYDSKGLEVKDFDVIKNDLLNYLKNQCGNSDPLKWIHSIFYCVNVKGGRLEDKEISFINDICGSISQTIHIVLTNCDSPDSTKVIEMENYIRSILKNSKTKIIKVNSVETNSRIAKCKQFGREEALETIFSVLWLDIAYKVSHQYAKEFRMSLDHLYYNLSSTFDSAVSKMTTINVIKEFINEGGLDDMLEDSSDRFEEKRDEEMEKLSQKYTAIINPLIEFYNNYSNGFGYRIQMLDFCDFMPEECLERMEDLDVDDIVENSKMGHLMEEIDDADDDSFFGMLKMLGKTVGLLLRIQSLLKDVIIDIKYEFRKTLPTEDEIACEMYKRLIDAVE